MGSILGIRRKWIPSKTASLWKPIQWITTFKLSTTQFIVESFIQLTYLGCHTRDSVTSCISYLWLCSKSPQNLAARNNTHLLSHNFCRWRIWEQLSWVTLTQSLSQDCTEGVSQGQSHLKAQLREGLLHSSHMWPLSDLRSSVSKFTHMGLSTGLFHDTARGFP